MQDVEKQLIERAKALFAEGKIQRVVGWKKGLFDDDVNIVLQIFQNTL